VSSNVSTSSSSSFSRLAEFNGLGLGLGLGSGLVDASTPPSNWNSLESSPLSAGVGAPWHWRCPVRPPYVCSPFLAPPRPPPPFHVLSPLFPSRLFPSRFEPYTSQHTQSCLRGPLVHDDVFI
jgi:hypothetical protein